MNWFKAGTVRASTTTYAIDNLLKNSLYYFRVFAENAIGQSQPLETDQAIEAKPAYSKQNFIFFVNDLFLFGLFFKVHLVFQ